jgi:deoxyribonuclease-4
LGVRLRCADPILLGAHVSSAGGVHLAPARGRAIGATVIQVFTKTPGQWREPTLTREVIRGFRAAMAQHRLHAAVSHDSYLINLASPDPALRRRSIGCVVRELRRGEALGLAYVVSHPGNFGDDREAGLARNADALAECLGRAPGNVRVALETTAGAGTALGSTFDELADLVERVPPRLRPRVAVCADTCHLYAAGYDLVHDFDGVWRAFDRTLGFRRLAVLHLNDSVFGLGSRRDRHALIGEGALGAAPFRRIMRDARFDGVIKVIETPKGDDAVRTDRRMLRRLRGYRGGGSC